MGRVSGSRVVLLAVAALLIAGLVATEVATASVGPTAGVAKKKKKCSKKKRKKGKCGKSVTADPLAALMALFSGASFSGPSADRDSQYTDVYKFCRNGTYTRRAEVTGTTAFDPPVPFHTVVNYGGSWSITNAENHGTGVPGVTELKGTLVTTIDSYQDSEGHPAPPSPDQNTIVAPPDKPYVVIGDHPVWTPTPGGGGC